MGNDLSEIPAGETWTPQQWRGISQTGKSLLVSAAAGSGKTAVLARRCVYLVCEAERTCNIDDLLVVTFTEKTAGQMRTRIAEALRDRAGKEPSERLDRQLALVEQAQVSTLHAFCARLLRQHFHLVGIDPGFRVMAAEEASLLRREVAGELFERRYNDEDGCFHRLIDGYGEGNDDRVMRQMLHVHELLTSVVSPENWLADARRRIDQAIELPLEKTELGAELLRMIERGLDSLLEQCEKAIAKVTELRLPQYAAYLRGMKLQFAHWKKVFHDQGIDALAEACREAAFETLCSVRADVPNKELGKSLIDKLRKTAKEGRWRDVLRFSTRQWRDGLKLMRPHAETFLDLIGQFGVDYARAKRQVHALDFADLERFTLKALSKSAAEPDRPSPAARAFHRRFAHVLVDEFQDINEVQDGILSLVSRECLAGSFANAATQPNLFCVGDVKQSIYRFRLAEARRFLDRQQAFRNEDSHGEVIDLQANFRSRRPLLDAINNVFGRVMTADAVDIEYDRTHQLLGRKEYPDLDEGESFTGAPIDLHLVSEDVPDAGDAANHPAKCDGDGGEELGRTEREAVLVAMEIRRILGMEPLGTPMHVMHPGKGGKLEPRKATFRDIVILLRSMQYKAEQFSNILRQHGIPVYAASNDGYFASMEVRDMMALLALLDNQRQDIPLAAILRSPLAELAEAESNLARIRTAYSKDIPFHEAALRYAAEKADALAAHLRAFFARLDSWRHAAQVQPIADVIWTIYHETGYLAYAGGLNKGDQRVKNLMDLHERAEEFGKFQSRGLSRFMRFLEQLQEESDLGQPSTANEAEDVVRIMSIHAAKGLEFSIVFVPDLGKRINMQGCQGPILADRQAGLGMVVVDEQKRCRYPSLASTVVQNRLRQQSLAEELRVLYVAMTRAKEHLILIGTTKLKTAEKWQSRWENHEGPMPADAILHAETMLDWLGPTEVMTRGPRPVFRVTLHKPEAVAMWQAPGNSRPVFTPMQARMARLEPLLESGPADGIAQAVIERMSFEYPHRTVSQMRATQSVTGSGHAPLYANGARETLPAPALPALPNFLQKTSLSATDRGTATHLVLQYLDFQSKCDLNDIRRQIDGLLARRILSEAEAQVVDAGAIEWLLSDPVAGNLLRQEPSTVRRELPVNFPRPFEASAGGEALDRVMIRGRIDVMILGEKTAALLDYKTDNVRGEQVAERAAAYRPQLEAYRDALQAITGIAIDRIYLAFLSPRVMFPLHGGTESAAGAITELPRPQVRLSVKVRRTEKPKPESKFPTSLFGDL